MTVHRVGQAVIAFVAVAGSVQLLFPLATDGVYLMAMAVLMVAPWLALRWWRPPLVGAWRAVGVGIAFAFVGDVLAVADGGVASPGDHSGFAVADLFYAASFVTMAVALWLAIRQSRPDAGVDFVLDAGSIIVGTTALTVPFVVIPALGKSDGGDALASAIYLVVNAAFLGAMVRATGDQRRSPAAVLLTLGLGGWVAAGVARLVSAGTLDLPQLDAMAMTIWTASAIALAGGILHPSMTEVFKPSAPRPRGRRSLVASVLLLSAVPLVSIGTTDTGFETPRVFWALSVLLLAGLVTWQVIRLLRVRDQAHAEIARSARYFQALAENSSDALVAIDEHGIIRDGGPALARLLGADATAGQPYWAYLAASEIPTHRKRFENVLAHPAEVLEDRLRVVGRDGEERVLDVRVVNLLDDPDVRRIIVNIDDMTSSVAAEEQLHHVTYFDRLTGLPNLTGAHQRLDEADEAGCWMVLMDLDNFTSINEQFGTKAGDQALFEVGQRLQQLTRSVDLVARVGADEFLVHLRGISDQASAERFAGRVASATSAPLIIDGQTVALSMCIGIAPDTNNSEQAFADAAAALREARLSGRGTTVSFNEAMREATARRLHLQGDLGGAAEAGQLDLHYQPILDLHSLQVTGFEALLRWNHPQLGLIPPNHFIPIAEDDGLIIPIGRWVISTATAQLATWRRQHPDRDLRVSVNVSAVQLTDDGLVTTVASALTEHDIPPSALTLEITETALVQDPGSASEQLSRLAELGVRIAIDDFGTGYSSLAYLQQFPVHTLKIDRSFISPLIDDNDDLTITQGILDLARAMGLATVAEGIETDHQLATLLKQGCRQGQGYLFSPPITLEAITSYLAADANARVPAGTRSSQ